MHPEDLLDKEAQEGLTLAERDRLAAHLARCEVCRFERSVRADFREELHDEVAPGGEILASPFERKKSAAAIRTARSPRPLGKASGVLVIGLGFAKGFGSRMWGQLFRSERIEVRGESAAKTSPEPRRAALSPDPAPLRE